MTREMWLSSFAFCTFLLVACAAVFGYSWYHLTYSPFWTVLNTLNGFVFYHACVNIWWLSKH